MNDQRIFRIDKFLGINQAQESRTELRNGEASNIVNFEITDGFNLRTRPGIREIPVQELPLSPGMENATIEGFWTGYIRDSFYAAVVLGGFTDGGGAMFWLKLGEDGDFICDFNFPIEEAADQEPVKVFFFGGELIVSVGAAVHTYRLEDTPDGISVSPGTGPYEPTVLIDANPAGDGKTYEAYNLAGTGFKVSYSADGSTAKYVLPDGTGSVTEATVDGVAAKGSFDTGSRTFTFESAPEKGVNNVVIRCKRKEAFPGADQWGKMRFFEYYNGGTDTRMFFYGDGSNLSFYTGVPAKGKGFFLPAGNEIALNDSTAPITGMSRQDSVLMAFKPDGTYAVVYEPITLADGTITAGFYVRNVSRAIGNDAPGQVQLSNNWNRSISAGSVYEWKSTAANKDQRYCDRVSGPVAVSLEGADPLRIITADDDLNRVYYIYLNDPEGTVLVNKYGLKTWTVYKSSMLTDVRFAGAVNGVAIVATKRALCYIDPKLTYDTNKTTGEKTPIKAIWESGYMDFGADFLRKYSSEIWVSTLPEASSYMTVTASTDRRDSYVKKATGNNIFQWYNNFDYTNFSYNPNTAPKQHRLKLKIKKFVYYKLIFEVSRPGARATVMSVDQAVRYAGHVK